MHALLTSCGRPDLLAKTVDSFFKNQAYPVHITIHEDGQFDINTYKTFNFVNTSLVYSGRKGQHHSIKSFLVMHHNKYMLHLEDDWHFENTYDWINESLSIMEKDPTIIKVLARKDMVHPCEYDHITDNGFKYGILQPWEDPWHHTKWHGFSWNPGVTRLDLLKKFVPFPRWEQDIAEEIHKAGFKVACLEKGVYSHIGDGRSTH